MLVSTDYAGYRLADEWREHRTKKYKFKTLKKGRSVFGEFRVYADSGQSVYYAARVHGEQVYTRQNAWAFDRALDFFLSIVKPTFIGVAVSKDPKTRSIAPRKVACYYTMRTEDYKRLRREEVWDYTGHVGAKGRRGSRQYLIDIMFMHELSLLTESELIDFKLRLPGK